MVGRKKNKTTRSSNLYWRLAKLLHYEMYPEVLWHFVKDKDVWYDKAKRLFYIFGYASL